MNARRLRVAGEIEHGELARGVLRKVGERFRDELDHALLLVAVARRARGDGRLAGDLVEREIPDEAHEIVQVARLVPRVGNPRLHAHVDELAGRFAAPLLDRAIVERVDRVGLGDRRREMRRELSIRREVLQHDARAGGLRLVEASREPRRIDPPERERLAVSRMMIEPEPALERIRQIADHVPRRDRHLRALDLGRPREEEPVDAERERTKGG